MIRLVLFLFLLTVTTVTIPAFAEKTISPQGAEVYFINLKDGAVIKNPVIVQFGLRGMGVAPAGVMKENTGHHHLIIDGDIGNPDLPIPNDDKHRHFGLGQTETSLELSEGKHTIQLVLADHNHIPHKPVVSSKKITIEVKKH